MNISYRNFGLIPKRFRACCCNDDLESRNITDQAAIKGGLCHVLALPAQMRLDDFAQNRGQIREPFSGFLICDSLSELVTIARRIL